MAPGPGALSVCRVGCPVGRATVTRARPGRRPVPPHPPSRVGGDGWCLGRALIISAGAPSHRAALAMPVVDPAERRLGGQWAGRSHAAFINIISHLLSQVPYEPLPNDDVTLPERQEAGDYRRPNLTPRVIPTPF